MGMRVSRKILQGAGCYGIIVSATWVVHDLILLILLGGVYKFEFPPLNPHLFGVYFKMFVLGKFCAMNVLSRLEICHKRIIFFF